ncbi:ABC transporter substrate-binding protein [Jiangella anatolica]|uniref:Fe/B12 periplasmic-binding domain-containing protein n=1 Tax=Jiangella anatolica TaxID=2670374 RepID=A0A2W2BEW4_9ACTN|nr:ABC transporter substrate-binding protein [Jiangella anatolica]PZF83820.1 hypothetical protein C1I92_11070 [Jiangella anatolica]
MATTLLTRPAQIDDDATRRQFLAILSAAGILAGCGTSEPRPRATSTTRSVQDVFGATIEVPADPQRVVVMDQQILGNLISLGFETDRIAGFAKADVADLSTLDYLGVPDLIAGLTDVGTHAEPNAEKILLANPDLILIVAETGFDDYYGPIFKTLETIDVPTVAVRNGYRTFDESMELLLGVGTVVGRESAARDVAAALRERIDDVASAAQAGGALPTAAYLRVFGDSYGSVCSPILDRLGLPGTRPTPEEFFTEVSGEELGRFDHEVLFVSASQDPDETMAQLEAHPLWSRLPAVSAGRVHVVDDAVWGAGYSVPAYEAQLEDAADALRN